MNSDTTPDLTVQTLMALRKESDAVRIITERLNVREMGPADHIRTKHEVKAFVETGSEPLAESLLKGSAERREIGQKLAVTNAQKHRQGLAM